MKTSKPIVIVSGLPRSGTSLMMQMLAAGGLPIISDTSRPADINNPAGYYEFERVKNLMNDNQWIKAYCGKAVKVVSQLLRYLPADAFFKIIFMTRPVSDIIKSQDKMLVQLGKSTNYESEDQVRTLFLQHLKKVRSWAARQNNLQLMDVSFNDLILHSESEVEKIIQFLEVMLDPDRMTKVINEDFKHF